MLERLAAYAADPKGPRLDVTPIKQKPDSYRLRWGEWRALFDVYEAGDREIMRVLRVGHRREIYR
jgi:hypothetical protein